MSLDSSPFEAIFEDIERALNAQLYYLALMTTLALPDICVSLSCEPTKIWTNKDKYEAWCKKYIVPQYHNLTEHDCYRLRCGVVHNGNFGRRGAIFERIIFTLPGQLSVKEMTVADASTLAGPVPSVLNLALDIFCRTVIQGANQWLEDSKGSANVRANMVDIVRVRPDGLIPYVRNLPVIA